jgi:EpsI family protein
VTRHLLFPLLIICFALPIWDPLPPILQEMTTDVVAWITRLLGMPALREGHLIILPAGRLAINESCSGMSYLLAALTLGMLYAFLNYRGFWPRVLIIMVAGIAAILANMVRVFIVVYAAYKTDMQHPLVGDHFNLGWYLFGGLVLVLLLIEVKLHRHAGDSDTDVRQRDTTAAAQPCIRSAMQYFLVLAAAVVLIAAGPAMAWWLEKQGEYPQDIVVKLPAGAGGWSGPSVTQDRWSPVYHGAITGKGAYRKADQEVYLFVGHYPLQSQGKELVNDLNHVTNMEVWSTVYPQVRTARDGEQMFREQMLESTSGQRRLVWYWYRVGGRQTISDYRAKLLQLWGVLEGNRQATVIVIATDFDEKADAARQVLAEFLSAARQSLERVAIEK